MDSHGHVFIVDDDAGSRRSVAALLEPMQVQVQSFELAADFLLPTTDNGRLAW